MAYGSTAPGARVWAFSFASILACSVQVSAPAGSSSGLPMVNEAVPTPGVRDRGDDPAVVAVDAGGPAVCAGALVAADVVLTARRCVLQGGPAPDCTDADVPAGPARSPADIRVLVGDALATAVERARGAAVVVPGADALCGADVALIVLDAPIDGIRPLAVRPTGAAQGDHVRTVAFRPLGPGASVEKLVRDHVRVADTTAAEMRVAEACQSVAGGPAIDETTGEIVGVGSHADEPSCAGPGAMDVYERADAFYPLVGEALAKSSFAAGKGGQQTKKGPIDLGDNCARGSDCAAGVCVSEGDHRYCSRTCDAHDRCPAHFRCHKSSYAAWVCVEG